MRISFQNSVLTLGLTSLFKDSASQTLVANPAVYLYIVVPKNYELQVDTVESGKWHDRNKIEAIIPSGTKLKVIYQLSDDKDQNLLHMILAIDTERTNTSSHNCNSNEL